MQPAFHISGLLKVGQVRGSSAAAAFPSRPLQTVKEPGEREPEERERERGGGEVKADRVTVPLAPGSEGGETRLKDGPGMNIKKKHNCVTYSQSSSD